MRIEQIEIYSDATNAAVMRHPGRRFPGLLLQGDTLNNLHTIADRLSAETSNLLDEDTRSDLHELRDALRDFRDHYAQVLHEHSLPLPF